MLLSSKGVAVLLYFYVGEVLSYSYGGGVW